MPSWGLYDHRIRATHRRAPLIAPTLEPALAHELRAATRRAGLRRHTLGLMPDHLHLALSIPPAMPVAAAVSRLNGASTHQLNVHHPASVPFRWQGEYALLSFAETDLPAIVRHLEGQRTRHAANRLWPLLERIVSGGVPDRSG